MDPIGANLLEGCRRLQSYLLAHLDLNGSKLCILAVTLRQNHPQVRLDFPNAITELLLPECWDRIGMSRKVFSCVDFASKVHMYHRALNLPKGLCCHRDYHRCLGHHDHCLAMMLDRQQARNWDHWRR